MPYNGRASNAVRDIKKRAVYQWVAPKLAAGKRFTVLYIASNVYIIRYVNVSPDPGELQISRQFLDSKMFDLICVHWPQ